MKNKQERWAALLFIIASLLVLSSIKLPYWSIWIAAPQYPKGLVVTTYVTGAKGDVKEVDGLNHYIGMRPLGEAAPFERKIAIPGISAIAACLLTLAFLKRKWALVLLLPALALPFVFAGDLYWWLRDYGLNLDPKAALSSSVKPFIPPLFGAGKIAQFHVIASFKVGWYMTLLAAVLGLIAAYLRYWKPNQPEPVQEAEASDKDEMRGTARGAKHTVAAGILAMMIFANIQASHAKEIVVAPGETYQTVSDALKVAADGDTIRVTGGVHKGNFVVNHSVRLIGEQHPVLDGENQGTVIRLNKPNCELRGFIIRNSGDVFTSEDSGVHIEAPDCRVTDNRLENVLFGMHVSRAKNSVVARNVILSKALPVARRGDQIRVWYSDGVTVEENKIEGGRDLVLWYSKDLTVRKNTVNNGRYGLHFMYCNNGVVEDNTLTNNSVGVYLMYSRGLKLQRNRLINNRGPSGYGIGLKDMENVAVRQNLVMNNRAAMFVDNADGLYEKNLFAFNDLGIYLFLSVKPNLFRTNQFVENTEQVVMGGKGDVKSAVWEGNYWSDYAGYDANQDGIGDVPYKPVKLFETMTDKHAGLRVFIYSPSVQALDFAAKTFPLFSPQPKLTDYTPLMKGEGYQALGFSQPYASKPQSSPLKWFIASLFMLLIGAVMVKPIGLKVIRELPLRLAGTKSGTAVQVRGMTKRFGSQVAVDNFSLTVQQGETVALWGSNGAGKTTILRCLLGLTSYEGEASLLGLDAKRNGKQVRASVGYVPQLIHLHGDLTVRETLYFYAQLRHVSIGRAERLLKDWQLQSHADKQVNNLSGGMKQKLALVIALLSDPPVLLLDEPTAHLDVQARHEWRALLERLKAEGKTLIFCTHHMSEVRQLADRVVVLEKGRKLAVCSPDELSRVWKQDTILYLTVPAESRADALTLLKKNGFQPVQEGSTLRLQVEPERKLQPFQLLIEAGIPLQDGEWIPGSSGELILNNVTLPDPPDSSRLSDPTELSAPPKTRTPKWEPRAVSLVASKEIRDARSNRWFLFFAAIFSVLSLTVSLLGLSGSGSMGISGFGRTSAGLVNLVLLIVPLMGLVMGAMSIVSERDQKTLQTLLAQPLNRAEVLTGKFIGMALALSAAILFGFGISGLAMVITGATAQLEVYGWLVGFTLLLGLACLSLGFCLSVLASRSAAAIGAAIFLWLTLLFISDLGMMGTAVSLKLTAQQLLYLVLTNPAQVFKMAVIQMIQGNLEILGGAGLYATEQFGGRLVYILIGLLLGWIILPFMFALGWFTKRGGDA